MNDKQLIYTKILWLCLIPLRTRLENLTYFWWPWEIARNVKILRSCHVTALFIHGIPEKMQRPEFYSLDIKFINYDTKKMFDLKMPIVSKKNLAKCIDELAEAVPEEMQARITWKNPF